MREIKSVDTSKIEEIFEDSLAYAGIEGVSKKRASLLIRLFLSGIGSYFFREPDTSIDLGFMRLQKSAKKDELFNMTIIRSQREGIINAGTLYDYYNGELATNKELKGIFDNFINDLIAYSQGKEIEIASLAQKISKRK